MTNDMQSKFGIVDDGSTDKTIRKVQQFDKGINQAEDSVASLTDTFKRLEQQTEDAFEAMRKQPPPPPDDGGKGGVGKGVSAMGALGKAGRALGGDLGGAISQAGELGKQVQSLDGASSKGTMALGAAGIALTAVTIGLGLFQKELDKTNDAILRSADVTREVSSITAQGADAAADRIAQARQDNINEQAVIDANAQLASGGGIASGLDPFNLVKTAEETAQDVVAASQATINANNQLISQLEDEFGPALEGAGSAAKEAAAEITAAEEESTQAIEDRKKALEDQAQAEEAAAAKSAAIQKQIADDIVTTQNDIASSIAAANAKNRGAFLKAAAQNAEDGRKAQEDYNDAIAEADKDFFRESEKDHRDNVRSIQDIIREGTRTQDELLSERDFLGIDKANKIAQEGLEDVGINAEREREERLIAFDQQLEDMKLDQQRESKERKKASKQRLSELGSSLADEISSIREAGQQKLNDLKSALEAELELTSSALQQKLGMENDYFAASLGNFQSALSQLGLSQFGAGLTNIANNSTINTTIGINGSNLSPQQQRDQILSVLGQIGLVQ